MYSSQFPILHPSSATTSPAALFPDSLWVLVAGYSAWFTCVVLAAVKLVTLMLMRNGTVQI